MSEIQSAIAEYGASLPEGSSFGVCEGSKFHSPTPLVVRTPSFPGVVVPPLCATCRDNLAVFVALMSASSGELSWSVRRQFGNRIRSLGMRIWKSQEGAQSV